MLRGVAGLGGSEGIAPTTVSATDEYRESFEAEVVPQMDALFRFARSLTGGDATRAEDLVQETMLLAWNAWGRFEAGNVRSWLMTILRHRLIREYHRSPGAREDSAWEVDELSSAGSDIDPPDDFFSRIIDERVQSVVDALPPDSRAALLLSDVEGLTYAEMAQALGIPIGTVRSRLFRARRSARAALYRYAVESGYVRPPAPVAPAGTTCTADRELLFDFLKHELTAEVAGAMHEHLRVCCDCRACDSLNRSYLGLVRTALERQRCPAAVRNAVLGMLTRPQAR